MSRRSFGTWLAATAILVLLQSIAHLVATGPYGELDSIVDLDRSNGIPDVVSTIVIAVAAVGAVTVAWRRQGWERVSAFLLVTCLGVIAADDVVGVDRDFTAAATLTVTGFAIFAVAALAAADGKAGIRPAVTIAAGLVALVATLVVGQLPELAPWFERARGDEIIELQIIAKQGLELAGWGLVTLGLWDRARAGEMETLGRAHST